MGNGSGLKLGFLAREGFEGWAPEAICKELSKIGYRGVEWSRLHFDPRKLTPAQLKRLVTAPAEYRMEVSEIHFGVDYVSRDEATRLDRIEATKECIDAAADAGVHTVSLSTGPHLWAADHVKIPDEMSEGTAWQMVFDAFDQIVPAAEARQVYLAVEGVWSNLAHDFYTTLPLFLRYVTPYLAINMDPSHGTLCRNDIAWVVHQWGKRIRHAHLKDAAGRPGHDGDTFIFPLLGEGLVDWGAFFAAMRDIGYDGFFSVEFESLSYWRRVLGGDMVAAARLSWELVQALLS
jgi:sugar phosphate isomerase/epimerase